MQRILAIPLAAILLTLAACATAPTRSGTTTNRIDVDSYRLLAEIALANQRLEEATELYLEAALASDDPGYAERTARMANQLGLDALGHRAVARWRELDDDNRVADYFSGIFQTRSSRIDAAVEDFSSFLDSLTSDVELGQGFILILDALGSEPSASVATLIMRELNVRFPGTAQGQFGLAQLALRAGAFDLALEATRGAIDAEPEWPQAQLLYARTLLLTGRSQEALDMARELASEYDNPDVRMQFAELLLSAGETEAAENLLTEILDQNPGMPEAIRALAFLALTTEDLDDARSNFEMLRSNPDYRDETFYFLGRISELEDDYLQATRAYSRVTDGTRAVEAQGRVAAIMYRELNDGEGALQHLSEFGNANPRFAPEMLLAQAELLLNMDRLEDAFALIDTAVGEDGTVADQNLQNAHVSFYATLIEQAISDNELESAEAWMSEALARYPGNRDLRYSQARLLQEEGRLRRALGILEELVEEAPDDPTFLNALGYLLTDKLDRHTEARGYIQRALAMSPENGAILDSMGWVLYGLGEYELALDYLERAYRALEVTEVMAHIIDVQWALGNQSTALTMLDDALAESPDDPFLTDVRNRLRP